MPTKIEISLRTIFNILSVILGLVIVSRITDILIQLFIAFVLMTAMLPVVGRLQKVGMSKVMAAVISYFMLIASLIVVFAAIIPPLVDQTTRLLVFLNVPESPVVDQIRHLRFTTTEIWSLVTRYGGSLGQIVSVITSTFSFVFTIFTVLVMALYLVLSRDHLYKYGIFLFQKGDKEARSKHLMSRIEMAVGSWVRGELLLMLTIGVMTYLGLLLLNIPYALPLAIFAGLMEALPNLGPTISAVPAVLIAGFGISPLMGLITAVLYILIQQLENNFIVPQVMKHAVGIRPLVTIILILIGLRFGGVLGALLIVPFYIVLRVTLLELSDDLRQVMDAS